MGIPMFTVPGLLLLGVGIISSSLYSQPIQTSQAWREEFFLPNAVVQGFSIKLAEASPGLFGRAAADFIHPGLLGVQYPVESRSEHLAISGIWIGASVDTVIDGQAKRIGVVTTPLGESSDLLQGTFEMYPVDPSRQWYHTSTFDAGEPNKRFIDDDGDGKVDEDQLNGIDDDADDLVDEDYGAVSESDYYFYCTDTVRQPTLINHVPLGIKVEGRSYAWVSSIRKPILPIEYSIVNLGRRQLHDVYIGVQIYAGVGIPSFPGWNSRNTIRYWPELRTACVDNPIDSGATPIGFTILKSPLPIQTGDFRYLWHNPLQDGVLLLNDSVAYSLLNGSLLPGTNALRVDPPPMDLGLRDIYFSLGPIPTWGTQDTLHVAWAIVGGLEPDFGFDNVRENARFAQTLAARRFVPPLVLPSPSLTFGFNRNKVVLHWTSDAPGHDPEHAWDEDNNLASFYPEGHWRRVNPPTPRSTGGRVFEGYRLYRSEDPAGTANSFTLLKQWDVVDSTGPKYEYDTGIETTFVDSNIRIGKTYWYAVTSFGIPDLHVIDYLDFDGAVRQETLFTKSAESSLLASRKRVHVSFSPSHEAGRVLVVPNPYRTDQNYTYESGGWEGRARSWTEDRRLIRFIHLPPTCTIMIYSLTGDIVTTLHHDNPTDGELDWTVVSESGRAIASGVYIFTVESEYGRQIGKFVIIR